MEKLVIKNRKNQNISVILKYSRNPEGLAFIMHGLGGFKEQPHIQTLAGAFEEKGYTTVLFDTTNTLGESDGNYEHATITNYYEDLEDVIKWARTQAWYQELFILRAQYSDRKIGDIMKLLESNLKPKSLAARAKEDLMSVSSGRFILCGHSLGGFCVAFYAENHPQEVLAVAPISAVVSGKLMVEAYKRYEPENFRQWEKTGWLIEESVSKPGVAKRLSSSFVKDSLRYDLLPKVQNLTMPVLLIVGENDTSTPPDHVKILFEALPGPKELALIKDAPHTFRNRKHLKEIKNLFLAWLDKV
ncbi:hypothetical protein COS81_02505 [candidate division WWE3 bacterium CG06_land_8_20_14_3_00_42_16]|uniref:Serine aminopeptidase S33 domain-containing protein n=4 Tax=Katanobacteria TaxID=422282 RepID=A0A2M7AN79_UNCKA|nr:MAG: hypothetical protein AUJ38_02195 [bacterium CG1_02_42_9]PIU68825.1 MAG: hypothetical protein COS81_02505 [candidate division WWE3 bacterium CG06_land_8_20_14_3_00_42_16]PIZ42396.1 MAG: hypothetical protein COY34_02930 [candidate division WWE3 bacterium CG_4_10_14_0_2_um_filter_42_8]PJA37559.1 MAG: hypothetical protein CO181_02935 [candidate division WWE3 bacterium CG_4_9_14_3_um_filter_43_9]PJC69095.1 MAG: hypothetical protein CO015_01490 [candidate division WWE3 bacterium CG_4_8_14_3_u